MLKELKSQHRTLIQMSFNGFSNNEIAEKLGMTATTVSIILRSPLGQAYLEGLNDRAKENTLDVRKKLISLNSAALNTFERILDPKHKAPFTVQFSTAKDVLDRNGYKPSDKFEIDVFSHKSDDEIENEIKIMEAAIARSQITKGEQPSISDDLSSEDDPTLEDLTIGDTSSIPEDLPPDLQAKLDNAEFNPFTKID